MLLAQTPEGSEMLAATGKRKKKKLDPEEAEKLIQKAAAKQEQMDSEIESMKADWEREKKELLESKDQVQGRCREIQEQIKQKSEAAKQE